MFAVIMAGGSGTRFWPASRERLPKQFLRITSEHTMFEETLERVSRLVETENIYVVVNQLHEEITLRLAGNRAHVLVEPKGRNTAACVGLAAIHIARQDEDEPIIVLPSDHYIADAEKFAQTLRAASEIACAGGIVTIGIPPTRPETGFGYIETGRASSESAGESVFRVERFVEKPDYQTALEYLSSSRYLWNSGIFIFTARTILSNINSLMPGLHQGLREIECFIGGGDYEQNLGRVYDGLESVSLDYGVMEKTETPIYVLRGDFGWSDVGSWQALYELRKDEYDEEGNLSLGETALIESRQNLIYSSTGRVVSLLGVEGLVIVDTEDALLVTKTDHSQDVKRIPELLRKRGRTDNC